MRILRIDSSDNISHRVVQFLCRMMIDLMCLWRVFKFVWQHRLEQAVDDIKTFANTASFLANKLDTRIKGGEVKSKNKPKSRMVKAIASVPKPSIPKSPSSPPDPSSTNTSGMPTATSIATSQADFERLKPKRSQPPVGAGWSQCCLLPAVLRLARASSKYLLCVATNMSC